MRPLPRTSLVASAIALALLAPGVARAQVTATGVTLAWTAQGDDSLSGRGARYELRWSTAPITTLAQFSVATPVTGLNTPQPAGASESATITGLVPATAYWFALRTFDEVGNGSALSNVLQVITSPSTDTERPARLDLALLTAAPTSVTLGWTDVGDDSLTGTASAVEVRWSTAPIDDTNWDAAVRVYGEPTPGPAGTPQQLTVNGLDRTQDLWFGARARDDVNRMSTVGSPLGVGHLLDTAPPATPTGGRATLESPYHVHLRWSANAEPDLAGYFVYRALDANGPFQRLTATPIVPNDYVDASPPDTLAVWYGLSAVDATGNESARSSSLRTYLQGAGIEAWDVSTPYPNPCPVGGVATLPLAVPPAGPYDALVEIQDAAGQHVRTLRVVDATPGAYALAWDGRNDAGRTCAPGVYRAWLRAGGQVKLARMLRTP